MADKFRLDNKVAVVIGGAGGIGEACALELARQGATVIVASRNQTKIQDAAEKIRSETGSEAGAFQVDVTDEESVKHLADQVVGKYGTVDILVNTHGINKKGPAVEFPVGDWDQLFAVNVKGVMLACKVFGKIMIEKGRGKIINMSSVRGIRGTDGGNEAYGATKGAVDMITRMLAAEWAPYNINVNALGPSLVLTETIKKAVAPERLKKLAESSLFKRLGTPEEIAGACVFLASEASDFMTGQILYVDGGLTAVG
jgi:NAD(P)-dependent dehydrogenase (short-subunit alcohol dehydrogenase family)